MSELMMVDDGERANETVSDTSPDELMCKVNYLKDMDPFSDCYVRKTPESIYYTFNKTMPLSSQIAEIQRKLKVPVRVDDLSVRVFKYGSYGPCLDVDVILGEHEEELKALQDGRKHYFFIQTHPSVRAKIMIERLINCKSRDLRRVLFALKYIFQNDIDLIPEFVMNKGLDCLMEVANTTDETYIDYILRAVGEILQNIEGIYGVMENKRCVQWLYSLLSNKNKHFVKTALKCLLLFIDFVEDNSLLLIDAIYVVDRSNNKRPWFSVMNILKDSQASDTESLICAITLINRCLNNLINRDSYYDQIEMLNQLGINDVIQMYTLKRGANDKDLITQFGIFEATLLSKNNGKKGKRVEELDVSAENSIRERSIDLNKTDTGKSLKQQLKDKAKLSDSNYLKEPETNINNNLRSSYVPKTFETKDNEELSSGVRRRDRYARQARQITQQEDLFKNSADIYKGVFSKINMDNKSTNVSYTSPKENYSNAVGTIKKSIEHYANNNTTKKGKIPYNFNGNNDHTDDVKRTDIETTKNCNLPDIYNKGTQRYVVRSKQKLQDGTCDLSVNIVNTPSDTIQKQDASTEVKEVYRRKINREHTVKDITNRLTSPLNLTTEEKQVKVADMADTVIKAKGELVKPQPKEILKSPSVENGLKVPEIKLSEIDIHWEDLKKSSLKREMHLCDLDFSDLKRDSDDDVISPAISGLGGPPPPPPNIFPPIGMPPPLPGSLPKNNAPNNPRSQSVDLIQEYDSGTIKKNKKTVKLFWREINENPIPDAIRSKVGGFIWDQLPEIAVDTTMLEHLFESKTNDLIIKKLMEPKRNLVLDAKRSNAINIAMKKLPTPQTIKAAIVKMDATVIGREGIEKLLTMLPTEEEKVKIQQAQYANPDLPLGSAEQFLLTLTSINELSSRLKLWVFKLDFDNIEKEIAEPLMDLKQGIELLKINKTFKVILSTLRSVGSFLNGCQVKGFRLEYLSKVMEVKDTVHKHPLLYHICEMIIEKFPDSTDFFSEVGPVIRASKVDFDVLGANLQKLEADCKASWDHMKRVAKHDDSQLFITKINEFLIDAAERIILLGVIQKKIMSRYNKFLLYLGVPPGDLSKTRPSEFFKVIAEFALEYRTTRERVLQQLEKRANYRERTKTRGKMITEIENNSGKNGDQVADRALKELLISDHEKSLTEGRRKSQPSSYRKNLINSDTSADDEIIQSLVRSAATKRTVPREKRRNGNSSDKRYFNRTLDGHQSWPGRESVPE